jgi:putative flippase GtrA
MTQAAFGGEFVRFLLAGGAGALANLGSRWLFSLLVSYEIAVALAYLVGMATAFVIFRMYVFSASGKPLRNEVIWFVLVNLAALAQVWLVSVGLYRHGLPAIGWTWHPDLVAHCVGVLVPIAASYIGHKHLTFSRKLL